MSSRKGQVLSQALMEAEVSAQIGALPSERSTERAPNRVLYELLEPARLKALEARQHLFAT